jgi:hypothetical protein
LFLAFPAVFCASATLIEKHERDRKQKAGLPGTRRGRQADALGAAIGSFGLLGFAAGHVDAAGPHGTFSGIHCRHPGLDACLCLPVVGLAAHAPTAKLKTSALAGYRG